MSYGRRGSSGTIVVERRVHAVARICGRRDGGRRQIVLRQVRQQCARRVERARLVRRREMRDATPRGVRRRAAQEFGVDVFMRHGLHDARPGDEHVARALDHDREVGDRRRVDRAAGARPEDHRDLRHDARRQDVAQEDLGVSAERHDAFLDPRASGIVEPDDRRSDLHREIHHLADLVGVGLRQRSAEHREVLAEDEHRSAVDLAVAGDDAVAEERLFRRGVAIRDERVEFDERIRVEQQVEPLARRQLARGVLFRDAGRAAAEPRLLRASARGDRVAQRSSTRLANSSVRCLCARTVAIIDTVAGASGRRSDIHRFGEQLANRVDNQGPETGRRGYHGGTRSHSADGVPAVHRDSEVMPR